MQIYSYMKNVDSNYRIICTQKCIGDVMVSMLASSLINSE